MEFEEGAVGLAVEHLHKEKFSDNSEAELGLITRKSTRKRKRGSQTDVSCSSYSSGAGSPLNLPYGIGFIGNGSYDSTDENSDGSRVRSLSRLPGYHSATTAVVSDSEDEIDFPNDVTDLDTFSVEYEPPESNSEDESSDDESDTEQVIIIPSSSEDEDPGAEAGDEYDVDSESEDSWECPDCWTINYPMTTKCLMCWKERRSWMQQLNCLSDKKPPSLGIPSKAISVLERTIAVSLSRSSSSCSSSTQASSDSGVYVSSCETELHDTVVQSNSQNDNEVTIVSSKDSSLDTPIVITTESSLKDIEEIKEIKEDTSTESKTADGVSNPQGNILNLCVICSTEPRNASIIHGRSGHQVCCITCAEKLKAGKKRCPVCRRRIHFVIKNFL